MRRIIIIVIVLLSIVSDLPAQVPPPLTPGEIARLRAVKSWMIEYTYDESHLRTGGGSLSPGQGGWAGKVIDSWILAHSYVLQYGLTATIAGKNGQSHCGAGSDSCIVQYTYPGSINAINEALDRFEEVHFPECCPDGSGVLGPGIQNLHSTLNIPGSKPLDGTGSNWIRGSLEIDYGVNPPVATAFFVSPTLGGTSVTQYEGWYRSDSFSGEAGADYNVDIYPYDTVNTLVGIEDGRFVIRGSTSYSNDYVPCPEAWLQCDSNTRKGTANQTITSAWVITASPDSSIFVTRPSTGTLFVSGEYDTIRWMTEATDSLRILYSTDSGKTYTMLAEGIPAAVGKHPWDVPEAFSRKCRVRIESMADTGNHGESELYGMKGYVLTRITPNGDYEAFTPVEHGWSFPNTSQYMWPVDWWYQFDYQIGEDPYTSEIYPSSLFHNEVSSAFPDWPLFVRAFGLDTCFTSYFVVGDSTKYRYSTWLAWAMMSQDHQGSCEGMAVSAAAAFGSRSTLVSAFPALGAFTNIADLALTNPVRQVINQIHITQHSQDVKSNERLPGNSIGDTLWFESLKSIFLSEERSNDASMALYSSRGGAHAVTPYKITKDSSSGPGVQSYLIWIYDPNYPADTTRAMLLTPATRFWRYPAFGPGPDFINYDVGLHLNSFALYMEDADLVYPKTRPRPSPVVTGAQSARFDVLTTTDAFITIKNPHGDSVGYADSLVTRGISGAEPIMMKTGYFLPPIGYLLPDTGGPYTVSFSEFSDTASYFMIFSDSMMIDYSRSDAAPGQSDNLVIGKNSFEFFNPDTVAKEVNLRSVLVMPDEDRVTRISGYAISGGGESKLILADDGNAQLAHGGQPGSYVLEEFLSREGDDLRVFRSGPIPVSSGATHTMVSDWTDLAGPVKILIDEGSDGSVDDSVDAVNILTAVGETPPIPTRFALFRNYPNPFNPQTTITYEVPTTGRVVLSVHDVLGRVVARLIDGVVGPGRYEAVFEASMLPGGVYYYTLTAGSFVRTEKMLLLK